MVRKRRWKSLAAWILAFAMVFGNSSFIVQAEEVQTEEKTISFDCYPLEYNEDGGSWTWIYAGQQLTIYLNMEGLDGSDYQVEWEVTQYDEETDTSEPASCVSYEVSENGMAVTLTADQGTENIGQWFDVVARVLDNNEGEIASTGTGVEVREQVYEYDFPLSGPGGNQMLLGQDLYIDPAMWCWYEDASEPYGADCDKAVTAVDIINQYTWDDQADDWAATDETIISLDGDQTDGWNLHGENYGYADITITYESAGAEGETEEYNTEVYVNGDIFWLNWEYPNGTEQVLKTSDMTIENITMTHDYMDDENNYQSEEVKDFTLSVTDDDGDATYDDGLIDVKIGKDNQSVSITPKGEEGGTNIYLRGMIDGEECCGADIYINVTDGYFNIAPVSVGNVNVGETLDLNAIDWALTLYYVDENGKNQEESVKVDGQDYRIRLADGGYDENAWTEADSGNALLPAFVRKGSWGTDVSVIAEERECDEEGTPYLDEEGNEIWNEVARRDLHFDDMEYWTDLKYSYGHRDESKVFTGSPLKLTLIQSEDSPCTLPEGYTVEWEVLQYDDEVGHHVETDCVDYEVSEDGMSVTLKANPGTDNENIGQWVDVGARILYDGEEIAYDSTGVEVCNPELDYYYPLEEESSWLPGWEFGIDKTFGAWRKDADCPEGEDFDVTVTDISVKNNDETAEDVMEWSAREDKSGWDFRMINYGDATITLTTEDAVNGEQTHEFIVHVGTDVIELGLDHSTGIDQMLPGASLDVRAYIWWSQYDEETGEYSDKDTSGLRVEWTLESGEHVVTIKQDADDSRLLHVTASEDVDWDSAHIEARVYDENGDELVCRDCWINVSEEYDQFIVERLIVEPGDVVSVSDLGTVLKHYSREEADGTVIEDVLYDFSEANSIDGVTLKDDTITVDADAVTEEESPRYDSFPVYASIDGGENWGYENWCEVVICKHQWDDGVIEKEGSCTEEGVKVYTCDRCGTQKKEAISSKGHQWGSYTTKSAATVFAAEQRIRTCSECGATETCDYGSKLAPTIKLTASSLKMKVKQKTTAFKVTGMANGDYVKSVTSSNTKILKVSGVKAAGTFKLAAQKKTGTATLTIKLASGLTKKVKVKVQKGTVKTTKISGLSKKLTVKKGKTVKLVPVLAPVTSQQKVTYKSSNKKIATVTSKGVIKGKKAGKAKITVKSGSKKYVVTVTVK